MGLGPHFPKLPGSRSAEGLTQPRPAAGAWPGDCSHGGRPHPRTTVTPALLVLCPSPGPPYPRGPSPSLLLLLGSLLLLCPQWPRCQSPGGSRGAGQGGAEGGAPSPTTETKFKLNRKQKAAGDPVHRAPPPGPADPAPEDSPASCTGAKFEQPGTRSARWPHLGPGAGSGRHLWDCLQDQVDGAYLGGMMHSF